MTKLTTHLPLETIQKSKALQGIKKDEWDYSLKRGTEYVLTIADVIDNAEELFGNELKVIEGHFFASGSCKMEKANVRYSKNILEICQQNKSIQEISAYILENIKE